MFNIPTKLPSDVNAFLYALAQIFEPYDTHFDINDIVKFGQNASYDDIAEIRPHMIILADLDFDFSDEDAIKEAETIVTLIKRGNNA